MTVVAPLAIDFYLPSFPTLARVFASNKAARSPHEALVERTGHLPMEIIRDVQAMRAAVEAAAIRLGPGAAMATTIIAQAVKRTEKVSAVMEKRPVNASPYIGIFRLGRGVRYSLSIRPSS